MLDVGGLRIAYERAGAGPPLILLHGFVGDGRSTWRDQIDALSDEFTVIAWDAPGAGSSSDPPEWFRMPNYAECLAGFAATLGLERAHVAGLSFGGALALQLAHRYPTIPSSLVLVGAYAGWTGSLGSAAAEQRLRQSLESSTLAPDEFVARLLPSMFSESASRPRVDAFAASVAAFHPAGFRAMAAASAESDLRDALPHIEVPVLVIAGDADVRSPLEVAEALLAALPQAQLVVLTGVGHVSTVEAPERVNTELRAFLQSHPMERAGTDG